MIFLCGFVMFYGFFGWVCLIGRYDMDMLYGYVVWFLYGYALLGRYGMNMLYGF